MLTLAAAKLGGYTGDKHVKLAAAVEFIHTATLLHDDVVDESTLRRGKVAANLVWGNKPTVLVGDFLFSRAFQLMVETGSLRVLDILAGASAIIAEGEVMQLKSANNLGTTEEDYLRSSAPRPRRCSPPPRSPAPSLCAVAGRRSSRRCATMARISASRSSSSTTRSTIPAARR